MSVNSTDPGTLFGGTWERIQDRFLLAAGSSYSAGATGGSANAIVVSHDHTFTGTAVTSAGPSNNATGSAGAHTHDTDAYAPSGGVTAWTYRSGSSGSAWKIVAKSAGAHTHTLNNHTHSVTAKGTIGSKGSSGTGANMPPYLVVYVWKRVA